MKVYVRQNYRGSWWCSTTYEGVDIYTVDESIGMARFLMFKKLSNKGYLGIIKWQEPVFYRNTLFVPSVLPQIGYQRFRIDTGMI